MKTNLLIGGLILSVLFAIGFANRDVFAATILLTNSSDTLNTGRTNTNTSLTNLNTVVLSATTSSNTWAGTQTFTNPIVIGSLSGALGVNLGTTYAFSTSTISLGGTLATITNASTTLVTASYASSTTAFLGTLTLPNLGTAAGTFLAANASGQVIATTSPTGSGGGDWVFVVATSSVANTTILQATTSTTYAKYKLEMTTSGVTGGGEDAAFGVNNVSTTTGYGSIVANLIGVYAATASLSSAYITLQLTQSTFPVAISMNINNTAGQYPRFMWDGTVDVDSVNSIISMNGRAILSSTSAISNFELFTRSLVPLKCPCQMSVWGSNN